MINIAIINFRGMMRRHVSVMLNYWFNQSHEFGGGTICWKQSQFLAT